MPVVIMNERIFDSSLDTICRGFNIQRYSQTQPSCSVKTPDEYDWAVSMSTENSQYGKDTAGVSPLE